MPQFAKLGVFAAIGGALLASFWLGQRASAKPPAAQLEADQARVEAVGTEQRLDTAARAKAQRDDWSPELARAVLAQTLAVATTASPNANAAAAPDRAVAEARATLDERLARSTGSRADAERLRQLLERLVDSRILGDTAAEVNCGASLCRVDLIGEEPGRVAQAVQALVEKAPKTFSNVAVYPQGETQRAVYLATNAEDLQLGPPPEREPAPPPPEPTPE